MQEETTQWQGSLRAKVRAAEPARAPLSRKHGPTAIVRGRRFVERNAIPPDWWLMGPVMVVVTLLNVVLSWSLPGPVPGILCGLAIVSTLASRWTTRLEEAVVASERERYSLMASTVGFPMLLFGVVMASWMRADLRVIPSEVVVMAVVDLVATVMCNGRLFGMISARVALWLGLAFVTHSPLIFLAVALGGVIGLKASMRQYASNVTAQRNQEAVERAQQRAELILSDFEETGLGWFWETDRRGQITYVSPTIGDALGVDTDELIGTPFTELFNLEHRSREGERTLAFHLSTRTNFKELAVRAATLNGEERWWSINGLPIYDDFDTFQGFRGSGSDLTERLRSEEKVTRLAHFDSLTGLANRLQISQTLEKILTDSAVENRACAVFLIDLDRFKQVNDTMGHPAGDALLTQVSQRLEQVVNGLGKVGRLGGDEFQIVIPGAHADDALALLADQIIDSLSQPYTIDNSRVVIGASVGIAIAPDNGVTSEALIRNADLALYAAKDGGRGRHHFYAPELHSDAEERRELEQDLRDAIVNGGLELYYQPVVATTTEEITGLEALLRWHHPTKGALSPTKFIPIAEDAGLIAQIGEWALRTACRDVARWPDDVRVAVNVSPLQFANPALPSIVTNALASAQVAPHRLELEITESVFLNDSENTEAMFLALDRIGVRLALDDFGTGYSSLGYLKRAPFDKIKIDQSFVRGATDPQSRNGAIISSIVNLAEALGMETTAEGVETLDELDLIRALGCSHVQGFIYARPLKASSVSELLSKTDRASAKGPRTARTSRQSMLRRVVLSHGGRRYDAMIRNISPGGAMITGLWNVPDGTEFVLELGVGQTITARSRWSRDDYMGVIFDRPLDVEANGRIALSPEFRLSVTDASRLRKAG